METGPDRLPTVFTPEEVADLLGVSPRLIREKARALGTCSILGKRMIMTAADVDKLLEAAKPEPRSNHRIPPGPSRHATIGPGYSYEEVLAKIEAKEKEKKAKRKADRQRLGLNK